MKWIVDVGYPNDLPFAYESEVHAIAGGHPIIASVYDGIRDLEFAYCTPWAARAIANHIATFLDIYPGTTLTESAYYVQVRFKPSSFWGQYLYYGWRNFRDRRHINA